MGELTKKILGLLSPLIIFISNANAKKLPEIYDITNITNVHQVELIPKPPPLILKQADFTNDILAGHRSHSSHSSHYSHRSSSYPAPIIPSTSSKSEEFSPNHTPLSPKESASKQWRSSSDWQENPYKLCYHEVIVTLKDDTVLQGLVTECKDDSIELKIFDEESAKRVYLKNIKTILWH